MPDVIHLDHVALASDHAWDQLVRYGYHLGARWLGGPDDYATGDDDGFYFAQMELEFGTKLEFIQPLRGPGSDFVRRFLDRNGPGPHHLTFKVPDLDDSIEAARSAGYEVVGESRENPEWHEAFLHPKQSHGIVIQFAFDGHDDGGAWADPLALPPPRRRDLPVMSKVVHLVADLESAVDLFTGPLAMQLGGEGVSELGRYVQVSDGPWIVELTHPAPGPAAHWMGARPGRLESLHLRVREPATVPDVRPVGDGTYLVPPEHNLGTRLRLAHMTTVAGTTADGVGG